MPLPGYGGRMQQARPSAGSFFASLGGALGLSLLAHAALLTAIMWALHSGGLSSVSRHKGADRVRMKVTLVSAGPVAGSAHRAEAGAALPPVARRHAPTLTPRDTPPASPAPQAFETAVPRDPSPQAAAPVEIGALQTMAQATARPSNPASPPTDTSRPSAPSPSAESPGTPPSRPDAPPGTSFTNMFAPVIARPLGRGRWGSPPPRPEQPPAEMLREQARIGLRQNLAARIGHTQSLLEQAPLQGPCDIRLDLDRRLAQVRCTDQRDEPRLWAMLDQLAFPGPVTASDATTAACLAAQEKRIQWQPCMPLDPVNSPGASSPAPASRP